MRTLLSSSKLALSFASVVALAAACGGSSTNGSNLFGSDQSYGGSNGSGSKNDAGAGGSGAGDDDSTGSLVGDASTNGSATNGDAGSTGTTTSMCNSVNAAATQTPLNIVIMLDKSGSMGSQANCDEDPDNCLSKKWNPVTQGLEAFLENSGSTNMSAAMQFFPYDGSGSTKDCSSGTYGNVAVAFTALPVTATSDPFKTAISKVSPDGDTPTLQALTGAINYATTSMTADTTGAKYVILFVTDGDPCGCGTSNNGCPGGNGNDSGDVQKVATEAATVAATIPTYVVGVGQDATNLDAIAAGGGTTKAFLATVGNPAQTQMDLQTALASIRQSQASCDFQIPAPPSGQSYDINAVNVQYSPLGGAAQTLPYDPNCTGAGWHYDSVTAPTEILLCGTSCDEVKSGAGGAVNVEFGCETQGAPIPGYDGGVMIR